MPEVPAFRFAGVDVEYALQRISTEAGWSLGLDEILPEDQSPDLAIARVDIDLPAGTLDESLRALKAAAGGFDYALENGAVYVRSNLLVSKKTALDEPFFDADSFSGDLVDLGKYIMRRHPTSFITIGGVQGGFEGPPAKFDIPAKASVRDVLLAYARASKSSWVIHRAGQFSRDASGKVSIVGTTIEPLPPRKNIDRIPAVYAQLSGVSALADASARLKQPLLVYDRSVLFDTRGILNLVLQRDPNLPLDATLDNLGKSGFGPANWHFHWRMEDGVPVVRSNHFLYYLRGRDIFSAELLEGDFEGTLGDLARWVNTHQRHPTGEVLMGGEIVDGQPRGKFHVASGDTVHKALLAFAKSSGESPYLVVLDLLNPFSGQMITPPRTWRGAYLQDLQEWHTKPGDERANGVAPPAEPTPPTK